jgi:hypothetical protein
MFLSPKYEAVIYEILHRYAIVTTWFDKIVTRRNNKAIGLDSMIRLKSRSAQESSEGLGVQEEAK